MNYPSDTDNAPLDGEDQFTPEERRKLRYIIREEDRMAWARKKVRVIAPALVALVVGCWQLYEWLRAHISFK